jgi:hypothetical protein
MEHLATYVNPMSSTRASMVYPNLAAEQRALAAATEVRT